MGCGTSEIKKNEKIFMITTLFNPAQFQVRKKLHSEFINRLRLNKDVVVITIECAFENDPFLFTLPN